MFPKIYIGKRNEKHFFLTTNEIILQEILRKERKRERERTREGGGRK